MRGVRLVWVVAHADHVIVHVVLLGLARELAEALPRIVSPMVSTVALLVHAFRGVELMWIIVAQRRAVIITGQRNEAATVVKLVVLSVVRAGPERVLAVGLLLAHRSGLCMVPRRHRVLNHGHSRGRLLLTYLIMLRRVPLVVGSIID